MSIPEDPGFVNPDSAPAAVTSRVLGFLRDRTGRPDLDYARPPTRLGGGFWAEVYAVCFVDPPSELSGELVLRVMPDEMLARKETVVQSEVAAQGFPAPAVRFSSDGAEAVGRAFMLMERAPGAPLMSGLSGPAALFHVGELAARLPSILAGTMARLHSLDSAPVRLRLTDGRPGAAVGVTDFLDHMIRTTEAMGRSDLTLAGRRLKELRPPSFVRVICHGDLHPFNLLADHDRLSVIDWTAALLAEPAYDVALTWLLLTHAPLEAPAALRPVIATASRLVGRSFLRKYRRLSGHPVGELSLNWNVGLHCLRALAEVACWAAVGDLESHAGHPWLTNQRPFADRVSQLTGIAISN